MNVSVLLAGGGTGGHVFPLVAVANAIRRRCIDARVTFVGTQRGLEASLVPRNGYPIEFVDISPIRGGGLQGALRGITRALAAMPQSAEVVRRIRPDVVLSVGGYAAGPITLAAWAEGTTTALLEPNSEMGLSNLCLAPLVDRAYTAFGAVERHFSANRVLRVGVPLREGFIPRPWKEHAGPIRLLVLGGSQGAVSLNETVPASLSSFEDAVEVRHQCGSSHAERVREVYKRQAGAAVTVEPFIEDMPGALTWADIVVSRAGASAISEICAIGRASILIPYPFAAGNHQAKNAKALVDAGAAVCLGSNTATPEAVGDLLRQLISNRDRLGRMSLAAQQLGRPEAANSVASDIIDLATRSWSEPSRRHGVASSISGTEV